MRNAGMGRLVTGAAVALAMAAFAGSQSSEAATAQATFLVSANVTQKCTISAAPLAFLAYDPLVDNATVDLDGSSNLTVACTKGSVGVWVGLNTGVNAAGSTRRMVLSGEFLTYELYSDAGRTTVWGNTLATGRTYTPVTSKTAVSIPVYGRVPSGQDVSVGAYNDTITATINF
jgi:spore coat protein U-like protein